MTNRTYRNYVKPVFFVIAFMVMILLRCAFLTHRACKCFYIGKFPRPNGYTNGVASRSFLWVVFVISLSRLFTLRGFAIPLVFYQYFFVPSFPPLRLYFQNTFVILFATIIVRFFFAFFTIWIATVLSCSVHRKLVDIFYFTAFFTLFIHNSLQRKMPPASWVKHETEGRMYFNTLCACLTQTHSINRIIS